QLKALRAAARAAAAPCHVAHPHRPGAASGIPMAARFHLVNRNGRYYWRRRLPAALARACGRAELCWSLRTGDPRRARQLALRLSAALDDVLHRIARRMTIGYELTRADLDRVLRHLYERLLESYELRRALSAARADDPERAARPGEEVPPDLLADPFSPGVE